MFLDQARDRARLPVVLLSGFLGSGKTTLVNALLRDPRLSETAVAINEFGEIPLDQLLIEHDGDSTVVMANGCLCCNLSGDMEDAVMRIFSRRQNGDLPAFKRLIVEPSGLADPGPIAQAILRNPVLAAVLRLEAIITTVDAVFAEAQIARHGETRRQVALADRLVITKGDLAEDGSAGRLRDVLRHINPAAEIFEVRHGAVDAAAVLPAGFVDPAALSDELLVAEVAPVAHAHHHAERTVSVSLVAHQKLRWRAVEAWLREVRVANASRLLRIKGVLNCAEAAGPVVVQGVQHVLHAPVCLKAWPDQDHRSRLVLILEGGDTGAIARDWLASLPAMLAQEAVLCAP